VGSLAPNVDLQKRETKVIKFLYLSIGHETKMGEWETAKDQGLGTEFQGGHVTPNFGQGRNTISSFPTIFCDKDNVVVQILWLKIWLRSTITQYT